MTSTPRRLLDLFCGRWGWSRAFAARGWECVGVDLMEPPETPANCIFKQADILTLEWDAVGQQLWDTETGATICHSPDFICASSPCQEFSVWTMPHFHPNPKYPALGIKLFNYTREICTQSGIPFVMENVCGAQMFCGPAVQRCGSFYLWGSGVPLLMPGGITKGATQMRRDGRFKRRAGIDERMYRSKEVRAAELATIAPELSACVADYAERICVAAATK